MLTYSFSSLERTAGILWGPDGQLLLYRVDQYNTYPRTTRTYYLRPTRRYSLAAVPLTASNEPEEQRIVWANLGLSTPNNITTEPYIQLGGQCLLASDYNHYCTLSSGICIRNVFSVIPREYFLLPWLIQLHGNPPIVATNFVSWPGLFRAHPQNQEVVFLNEDQTAELNSVRYKGVVQGSTVGKLGRDNLFYLTQSFSTNSVVFSTYKKAEKPLRQKLRLSRGVSVTDFDVSLDGTRLAVAVRIKSKANQLWIYDITDPKKALLIQQYNWPARYVAYSPDDSMLALFCRISNPQNYPYCIHLVDTE